MKKIPLFIGVLGSLLFAAPLLSAESSYQLAQRVAGVLGIGREGACSSCHATSSEQTFRRWARSHRYVTEGCLHNPSLTAKEKLYCMTDQDPSEQLDIRASKLGFWSAGLHLNEMTLLMQEALGTEEARALQAKLRDTTMMPLRSANLLTEAEFQDVQNWVAMGMPHLNELIYPYDGPTRCESYQSPAVKDHLLAMKEWGWQKRNRERGLLMFACGPDQGPCFRQQRQGRDIFPDVATQSDMAAWKAEPNAELRLLTKLGAETEYWIRSSADGRFVAYGGSPSGVVDLQSLLKDGQELRNIEVEAYYDPAFFPDDSAFVFQGHETAICATSLLKNPSTKLIDFSEDACTIGDNLDIPLYQAVGASLDGADYLAATGNFRSDIGDGDIPFRLRDARSKLLLQPLEYDGLRWIQRDTQSFATPWELDWGLAPSNKLLLSRREGRVDEQLKHIGYQLYRLNRDPAGGSDARYQKEQIGRLCFDGLKVGFSFDDRFVASYGYIKPDQYALLGYKSPDDPEFQARLSTGTANVFLFDLWTQKLQVVTHMGPGQYALFPHFRSDGWMYFMVYDQTTGERRLMAANNALLLQEAAPLP